MNTARRIGQRLVAAMKLLLLLCVVAGVPVLLWSLRGSPVPTTVPSAASIWETLTRPDTDAALFVAIIAIAGWLAWMWFTASVIIEVVGLVRGAPVPTIRGFRFGRRAAASLLGGALLIAPATALADPPAPAPPSPVLTAPVAAPQITGATTYFDYHVREGDSLWVLAEVFLGNSSQWRDIVSANPELAAAPESLQPGTVLKMPTNLIEPGDVYTVQPGDTLSAIAEVLLGNGDRWRDITDERGADLTSTLIFPGQRLHIPLSASHSAPQRPDPASASPTAGGAEAPPAPSQPSASAPPVATTPAAPPPANPAPTTPAPGDIPALPDGFELGPAGQNPPSAAYPTSTPNPHPTVDESAPPASVTTTAQPAPDDGSVPAPSHVEAHEESSGSSVRTIAGISGVAAAALLGLIAFRRRQQQHRRRRGERITLPTDSAASAEDAVRIAADPAALRRLDAALRHMTKHCRGTDQALPSLLGVFLGSESLELALLDDIDLPAPWRRTGEGLWSLPASENIDAPEAAVSPYPALTHFGTFSDTGAAVLINLEQLGHLAVTSSDPAAARGALRSLALFLALSPIADHLDLVLVGEEGRELADVAGADRVTHVASAESVLAQMSRRADGDAAALADQQIESVSEARVTFTDSDMTAPTVVVFTSPLSADQNCRLAEILATRPRVAFAAVATDTAAAWTLRITAERATLHEGDHDEGFEMVPAVLTDSDYHDILTVLDTTHAPAEPADSVVDGGGAAAVDLAIHEARSVDDLTHSATRDPNSRSAAGIDGRSLQVVSPEEAAESAAAEHIWIRILGKPTVTPLSGAEPERGRAALCTELATLLATHPGLKYWQIDRMLWPHDTGQKSAKALSDRRQTAMRRLRAWLGETSSGELAFPKHGDRSGESGYRLHPEVRTDWEIFQQLVPEGPAAAPTAALAAAADLVIGQPFGHTPPQRYGWAEHLQQEMISLVDDTLEELAARYIQAGDLVAASAVAEKGLLVDGAREGLWRVAIVAAHGQDTARAQRLIDEMVEHLTELDDTDTFEPETEELLRHLARHRDDSGITYRIGLAS